MTQDTVLLATDGPVATLTLNRPDQLNALSRKMIDALDHALDRIEADEGLRVVVVTGAGRAFCAGGDIAEMRSVQGLAYYHEMAEPVHTLFRRIELLDRPTIGAINGHALGGGAELMLALDLRLLSDRAQIGLPEIGLGLFPGAGGTQRLIRQVPLCRAKELLFSGEPITASEAVAIGLANRVVMHDALLAKAKALARTLAQRSPLAMRMLKRTIADGADMPLSAALRHEQAMIGLGVESTDARAGFDSFLQRRGPVSNHK